MLRRYLSREIDQWTRSGLLQPGQGEALLADHDKRHTGFSLSAVLAVLAAVLLGAAVIALIAANWEAFARPLRVVMVFVLILAGLVMAAAALRRGAKWIPEAAVVFTLLCYGAGIALVGQMYHLSGDEASFLLTWIIGALVVSLCFRSAMAAIVAGLLGLQYLVVESDALESWHSADVIAWSGYGSVLAVAAATGLSAWRSGSTVAGHLCALLLVGWILWVGDGVTDLEVRHILALIGLVAFAAGSLVPALPGGVVERHGVVSAYGAVLGLAGLGMIQFDLTDTGLVAELAFAALILIVSVAVLMIAGADNRMIRRFAYFAFVCETVYVVAVTLGSLLGSAGFLFLGGLALALVAFAVMKIEKRFNAAGSRS